MARVAAAATGAALAATVRCVRLERAADLVEERVGVLHDRAEERRRKAPQLERAERRDERGEEGGIVKDVRGSESNCEHDSRKM